MRYKTYLSLFIISFLVFQGTALARFPDVPSSHPNYDAIQYIQEQGIVSGYPDGTYHADQMINRAEFVKIIMETISDYEQMKNCGRNIQILYGDTSFDAWYFPYVCQATFEPQIINGYPDGTFRPGQRINFVEAAKIMTKALGLFSEWGAPVADPWYRPYVDILEEKAAIPTSIDSFDSYITRGEMAEMIYRLNAGITDKPSMTYDRIEASGLGKMRTYINDEQKFKFEYPANFSVATDGVHMHYQSGKDWYRVELFDGNNSQNPWLTAEVNPDGYGPIFADKLFTVAENMDGSLNIVKEENFDHENTRDGVRILVASSFEASNGNNYYWRFAYREGGDNMDQAFLNILLSARIEKSATEMNTTAVKLYFGDKKVIEESDCSATRPVIRRIPKTSAIADATLRLLLQGTTPEDEAQGLVSSFDNRTGYYGPQVRSLLGYYQGITIMDGVATVKFSGGAMAYLNNAACAQAAVKGPIEDTLLQFPSIERIQYSIDGKVIEGWDA